METEKPIVVVQKSHTLIAVLFASVLQLAVMGGLYYAFVYIPQQEFQAQVRKDAVAVSESLSEFKDVVTKTSLEVKEFKNEIDVSLAKFNQNTDKMLTGLGFKKVGQK